MSIMNPFRRGTHNLSNSFKTTMNMGWLTPIACFDVAPGDKIKHKINALIRTQPLLAPVMHLVDVDIHAYYVPNRIIHDDWEDFITGGDDGMAVIEAPYQTSPAVTGYAPGSLMNLLGVPANVPDLQHSAYPARAYNLIYNTAYRDSQLQSEIPISFGNGSDTTTPRNLLAPCWKRDYFTKCRPAPQLGPDVVLPINGDATVKINSGTPSAINTDTTMMHDASFVAYTNSALGTPSNSNYYADLSTSTGVSIREQREANATQRFLEFNNLFGGRYIEQMMARFGSRIPDDRIQFPEYIGSGSTKIQFSEVLATAEDAAADVEVGSMKGHGISVVGSNRYRRAIPEFGWIMVMMIVRPKTQYAQGLHRSWSRNTRYDYLLPEFQDIGDQAVLNKEIYAASPSPNAVFGYTPQYEEYRTIPSRLAGEFVSSQDYWTLYREFSSAPALNSTFVTCNPSDRIFLVSVANADSLIVTVSHDIVARRALRVQPDYKLM